MAECGSDTLQAATRIHGSHHPNAMDLNTHVTPHIPAEEWENLGLILLDGDTVLLGDIKANTSETSQRCKRMFEKWLKRRDSTWKRLIAALESIGFAFLADQLKKMLTSTSADQPPTEVKEVEGRLITKPEEASAEFGILLNEILKVLLKNETGYLELLQSICSSLTVKHDTNIPLFSDEQLKMIITCDNIKVLFLVELRKCWRWDDFSVLSVMVASLNSDKCQALLDRYKLKVDGRIKLKEIYEQCKKENAFPKGFYKLVAIINNKVFSKITLKEYEELKAFTSKYCGVDSHALFPFIKASSSSLVLEWYIPAAAINWMIYMAVSNKVVFVDCGFIYMKIAETLIFDERDLRQECNEMLSYAARGDVANVERLLITRYVDVNAVDWKRRTALHVAAERSYLAVVETLIKSGADINAVDLDGRTALHEAAKGGHSAVVETLIKSGADVNAVDRKRRTALHEAAERSHLAVVETLIKSGADVNAVDIDGRTALHEAAKGGHSAVVETLIKSGAGVNAVDSGGRTALHEATERGHSAVVKTLIKSGADFNAVTWRSTALHQADYYEILETLIKSGADVNAVDNWRRIFLHVAALRGYSAVVETLIKSGTDVDAVDNRRRTALHEAAKGGRSAVVETLIKSGADVNAVNIQGSTALHEAAKGGDSAVVETLIKLGADVNAVDIRRRTALHEAAMRGDSAVVETLIKSGADINAVDKRGRAVLHEAACMIGHPAVVKTLIKSGADINAVDERGRAVLHEAARMIGHPAVVETLIKSGADVNAVDEHIQRRIQDMLKSRLLTASSGYGSSISVSGISRSASSSNSSSTGYGSSTVSSGYGSSSASSGYGSAMLSQLDTSSDQYISTTSKHSEKELKKPSK